MSVVGEFVGRCLLLPRRSLNGQRESPCALPNSSCSLHLKMQFGFMKVAAAFQDRKVMRCHAMELNAVAATDNLVMRNG